MDGHFEWTCLITPYPDFVDVISEDTVTWLAPTCHVRHTPTSEYYSVTSTKLVRSHPSDNSTPAHARTRHTLSRRSARSPLVSRRQLASPKTHPLPLPSARAKPGHLPSATSRIECTQRHPTNRHYRARRVASNPIPPLAFKGSGARAQGGSPRTRCSPTWGWTSTR